MDLVIIVLTLIICLSIYGLYTKANNGICKSKRRLDGKTCIVTGGTNGIGLQIAIDFAMRGARVIVACPFEDEGYSAEKTIITESGNSNVVYKFLDLASLDSVRKFAQDILKSEDRLDILMNNAGVGIPQKVTGDGMNIIMQVNYFGHFLLTILLLPLLKKSGSPSVASRIVNTSSVLHRIPNLDVNNMNPTNLNVINRLRMYGNSKLCLLLFSYELTKKLKGSNVVINDGDPTETGTNIYMSMNIIVGIILKFVFVFISKTTWEGAQTLIMMAIDEKTDNLSAAYYRNCRRLEPSKLSRDDRIAKRVWDESIKIVKLSAEEMKGLM